MCCSEHMLLKLPNNSEKKMQVYKASWCVFYARGRCTRGSNCTFAHTADELRQLPDLRKTKLCNAFMNGECKNEKCNYAHGIQELRDFPGKKGLCRLFREGKCVHGSRCKYAHTLNELEVGYVFTENASHTTEQSNSLEESQSDFERTLLKTFDSALFDNSSTIPGSLNCSNILLDSSKQLLHPATPNKLTETLKNISSFLDSTSTLASSNNATQSNVSFSSMDSYDSTNQSLNAAFPTNDTHGQNGNLELSFQESNDLIERLHSQAQGSLLLSLFSSQGANQRNSIFRASDIMSDARSLAELASIALPSESGTTPSTNGPVSPRSIVDPGNAATLRDSQASLTEERNFLPCTSRSTNVTEGNISRNKNIERWNDLIIKNESDKPENASLKSINDKPPRLLSSDADRNGFPLYNVDTISKFLGCASTSSVKPFFESEREAGSITRFSLNAQQKRSQDSDSQPFLDSASGFEWQQKESKNDNEKEEMNWNIIPICLENLESVYSGMIDGNKERDQSNPISSLMSRYSITSKSSEHLGNLCSDRDEKDHEQKADLLIVANRDSGMCPADNQEEYNGRNILGGNISENIPELNFVESENSRYSGIRNRSSMCHHADTVLPNVDDTRNRNKFDSNMNRVYSNFDDDFMKRITSTGRFVEELSISNCSPFSTEYLGCASKNIDVDASTKKISHSYSSPQPNIINDKQTEILTEMSTPSAKADSLREKATDNPFKFSSFSSAMSKSHPILTPNYVGPTSCIGLHKSASSGPSTFHTYNFLSNDNQESISKIVRSHNPNDCRKASEKIFEGVL